MSRPRNPDTEQRILQVALRQLSSEGYSRMSIDSIALDAGVSKPTIYRRWPNKADLATAAVRSLQLSEPVVDTGSTVGDLTGILQNFQRNLLRPNGLALVGTVLAEEAHTPELLRLFRERIVAPRRAMLAEVLDRAKKRKEIKRGVVIGAAVNMLVGGFYAHYLASPEIPASYPADLVAIVWRGIAA
jgi:AcrR family transcriptional regulator